MTTYRIPDMSCDHCVRTIEAAVRAIDGEARIAADLDGKVVTIATRAEEGAVLAALRQAGYAGERVAG